jgi:hypothetical protein
MKWDKSDQHLSFKMKVPPLTMHASLGALISYDGHSECGRGSLQPVRTHIMQNLKAAAVNGRCPNGPAFCRGGLGSAHDLKRKSNRRANPNLRAAGRAL